LRDAVEPAADRLPHDTADPISEFYTRHPYPPPVENLDRARDEWRDGSRARTDYHLFWPQAAYRSNLDILIAGCGTWQAAKYAVCRPEATVVGIDISPTSIEHTNRLKQKYGLTNLEVRQLPVEHVEQLQRDFDLIVSTGVLHHLADPDRGLRALRSVLRRDGAMYVMVYAPYGRAGIYMLQDYCRKLRIDASPQQLHDLLATLQAMPSSHPLVALLRGARDTTNVDALSDALLNPRDRSYSVPQLFDLLEGNGMTFGRWQLQAPYLARCGAIATTPHAGRLAALPEREQYAALELWRGTMASHSVIAYRNDAEVGKAPSRIDELVADFVRYVPVRLPWTRLVEERLPAGAAAILLNTSHQFHDLLLVIRSEEKRLFDAIDGHRTVADIAEHLRVGDLTRVRTFFDRLYAYDQIVFDRSRA
jgi:SAM-dependent methyltransferase